MKKILVTGADGQLGSELTTKLRSIHGMEQVIASDIRIPDRATTSGPFEQADVLDRDRLGQIVEKYGINVIYHLAALLSAKSEKNIRLAWDLNINGLLNVLNITKDLSVEKIFWPSSIAVFGPDAPKEKTPQNAACNPTTVYGISKVAGEQWCAYYFRTFGVDVRSLRYPGLIGYKALPGGGTTDYAVDIYHKALKEESYTCFLRRNSMLPMMYMEDAVHAAVSLMQADSDQISVRTSYNIAAMSFTPEEIAKAIRRQIPEFRISYKPDYRQKIADSWPGSIDDSIARRDWDWKPEYSLQKMSDEMLRYLPEYWLNDIEQRVEDR